MLWFVTLVLMVYSAVHTLLHYPTSGLAVLLLMCIMLCVVLTLLLFTWCVVPVYYVPLGIDGNIQLWHR